MRKNKPRSIDRIFNDGHLKFVRTITVIINVGKILNYSFFPLQGSDKNVAISVGVSISREAKDILLSIESH